MYMTYLTFFLVQEADRKQKMQMRKQADELPRRFHGQRCLNDVI